MFADVIKLPSLATVNRTYYINRNRVIYFSSSLDNFSIALQLEGYGELNFRFSSLEEFNQAVSLIENGK